MFLCFDRIENKFIANRVESLLSAIEILDHLLRFIPENESRDEGSVTPVRPNAPLLTFPGKTVIDERELVILLRLLLKLAIHLVSKGENIDYPFASLLPVLFYRTDFPEIPDILPDRYFPAHIILVRNKFSVLRWRVGKYGLAVCVLELCVSCYEFRVGSNLVFQICGVMIPKLVKNLDKTGLDDGIKLNILQGILYKLFSAFYVNPSMAR